jgi:excisionase family DNA binding protein
MSARQAAAYCGVADKMVRRWIASGRLAADRDGHDFRVAREVLDPVLGPGRTDAGDNAAPAAATSADSRAAPADLAAAAAAQGAALVELVARQEQTILELPGRVGWLQAENQQLRSTILALQAPREEPAIVTLGGIATADQTGEDGHPAGPFSSSTDPTLIAPPPPSWWRRFFLSA